MAKREFVSADPLRERLRQVLAEHWLAGIHCHHAISPDDSTYDWATCACSKVNFPHKGTVGEAVGTWIEHVLEQLLSESAPQPAIIRANLKYAGELKPLPYVEPGREEPAVAAPQLEFGTAEEVIAGLDAINAHNSQVASRAGAAQTREGGERAFQPVDSEGTELREYFRSIVHNIEHLNTEAALNTARAGVKECDRVALRAAGQQEQPHVSYRCPTCGQATVKPALAAVPSSEEPKP